jgi:hypothetical protein
MKTVLTLFSAIAFMCALAMPAAAQNVTQYQLNNFNAFLNHHPKIASQLHKNPSLVDNAAYLNQHPQLHSFLEDHDGLRRAIQTHPGQFMYSKGRYAYGWKGGWNPSWNRMPTQEQWEQMHNYGYADPTDHRWHDREWWENNRDEWVRQHHPRWDAAKGHERQDYQEWRRHHEQAEQTYNEHHDNGKHKGQYKHDNDGHDNGRHGGGQQDSQHGGGQQNAQHGGGQQNAQHGGGH